MRWRVELQFLGIIYSENSLDLFRHADIIEVKGCECMDITELLKRKKLTKYRLAVESGVPHATLSDIICGKTRIEKCSGETLYKLSTVLGVRIEDLIRDSIQQSAIEKSYETGLPIYLQNDLDAYKEGLRTKSTLLDCLWGELYGSINTAEISEGSITPEHAAYLRKKFLSL